MTSFEAGNVTGLPVQYKPFFRFIQVCLRTVDTVNPRNPYEITLFSFICYWLTLLREMVYCDVTTGLDFGSRIQGVLLFQWLVSIHLVWRVRVRSSRGLGTYKKITCVMQDFGIHEY